MTFSLNEIETEARKAVRGAGLPWGLAEEGGKAVRWLAERGIDAFAALLDVLDRHDGRGAIDLRVVTTGARWRGCDGPLCPLMLGAALCDHATTFAAGGALVAGPVVRPLLLTPFAARAARLAGHALALTGPYSGIALSESGEIAGPGPLVDVPEAAEIECRPTRLAAGLHPRFRRPMAGPPDPAAFERIEAYALRTYVPASEQSRLRGAGAGLIDND